MNGEGREEMCGLYGSSSCGSRGQTKMIRCMGYTAISCLLESRDVLIFFFLLLIFTLLLVLLLTAVLRVVKTMIITCTQSFRWQRNGELVIMRNGVQRVIEPLLLLRREIRIPMLGVLMAQMLMRRLGRRLRGGRMVRLILMIHFHKGAHETFFNFIPAT
jgi:hypothetical protein